MGLPFRIRSQRFRTAPQFPLLPQDYPPEFRERIPFPDDFPVRARFQRDQLDLALTVLEQLPDVPLQILLNTEFRSPSEYFKRLEAISRYYMPEAFMSRGRIIGLHGEFSGSEARELLMPEEAGPTFRFLHYEWAGLNSLFNLMGNLGFGLRPRAMAEPDKSRYLIEPTG